MKKKYEGLVIGFALFSMFFGAGNLIFPPFLGIISGSSWVSSMLGFLITGVGLPFLAIFALTKTNGSIYEFAGKVSNKFSMVFNSALILAIGPLLAMPRTGATTFEMGVLPIRRFLRFIFHFISFFLFRSSFFFLLIFWVFIQSSFFFYFIIFIFICLLPLLYLLLYLSTISVYYVLILYPRFIFSSFLLLSFIFLS